MAGPTTQNFVSAATRHLRCLRCDANVSLEESLACGEGDRYTLSGARESRRAAATDVGQPVVKVKRITLGRSAIPIVVRYRLRLALRYPRRESATAAYVQRSHRRRLPTAARGFGDCPQTGTVPS